MAESAVPPRLETAAVVVAHMAPVAAAAVLVPIVSATHSAEAEAVVFSVAAVEVKAYQLCWEATVQALGCPEPVPLRRLPARLATV
jgi:hypothetical protein